jgi:GrpB-like predicted nucleotidyltransferase (UPF0157 family)
MKEHPKTTVAAVREELHMVAAFDESSRDRSLEEMTQKERSRLFPVILCEHNPAWAEWFAEEKTNLERLIGGGNIFRITHYGSTAVPGLLAKPTVDILLEINADTNIKELKAALPYPEYIQIPESDNADVPPLRLMFIKGYTRDGFAEKVYHIHVRYPGDWDEVYFRDYLIACPEAADAYAVLKQRLKERFGHDRDGYTDAKGEFIKEMTRRAKNLAKNMDD